MIGEKLRNFLKNLFGPKQNYYLPERTTTTSVNPTQEKRDSFVRTLSDYVLPAKNSVEYAIDQYVNSLYQMYQGKHYPSSYRALVRLGAYHHQEPGNNKQNEEALIAKLSNDKNYSLTKQPAKSDFPAFYHVISKNYSQDEQTSMRLYVNTSRENISALSQEFIAQMGNKNFYFKFSSDDQATKTDRSESMVIYTDQVHAQEAILALQKIRAINPKLFPPTNQMNPFLKSLDGIVGIAPNPVDSKFTCLSGKNCDLPKSYNKFLSKALEESFISSSKEIISKDKDLTLKTGGQLYSTLEEYLPFYPQLMQNHSKEFMLIMKNNLKACSQLNPILDIKGICSNIHLPTIDKAPKLL